MDSVLTSLIAGAVGGATAGCFTLYGVILAHKKDLGKQEKKREETTRGFLQTIYTQLKLGQAIYQANIGQEIERLKANEPLDKYYPEMEFLMFCKRDSNLIGQIRDHELRKLIVRTEVEMQGLNAAIKLNNNLREKYWSSNDYFKRTSNPKDALEADSWQTLMKKLVPGQLKPRHEEVKEHISELLEKLRNNGCED